KSRILLLMLYPFTSLHYDTPLRTGFAIAEERLRRKMWGGLIVCPVRAWQATSLPHSPRPRLTRGARAAGNLGTNEMSQVLNATGYQKLWIWNALLTSLPAAWRLLSPRSASSRPSARLPA